MINMYQEKLLDWRDKLNQKHKKRYENIHNIKEYGNNQRFNYLIKILREANLL